MGAITNKNDPQNKQAHGWTTKTNCPNRYILQDIYDAKWTED